MHRRPEIKTALTVALLMVVVIIQVTLSPYMKIGGVHPDLIVILVIAWTILRDLNEGILWALVGGLSLDFVSAAPFGLLTLAMVMVALGANLAHGRFFGSSVVLPIGFTFPLSILFNLLVLIGLYLFGRPVAWIDTFYAVILPVALLNTGLMIFVYPTLSYLNRLFSPKTLSF